MAKTNKLTLKKYVYILNYNESDLIGESLVLQKNYRTLVKIIIAKYLYFFFPT